MNMNIRAAQFEQSHFSNKNVVYNVIKSSRFSVLV